MLLHELMGTHRDEILAVCRSHLHDHVLASADLDADIETFYDEVLQALRNHYGFEKRYSPLPGHSEAAARLGQRPQRAGLDPAKVPLIFGALSNAIGLTGEHHGLQIGAEEYKIFNQCIDAGVAVSIENFWRGEKEQEQQRITERVGYLAHELRNALGNAALAFKLLREGNLDIKGRTADVVANNLVRMETLVARTLGSVHLDSGVALELRAIRVANVLRQLQASAIPERAIAVTLEVDESLHVQGDEMLLTSAVSNLLHNAIKFSRTGGHITLCCRSHATGVSIEVEDECGGLPYADISHFFRPLVHGGGHPDNVGLGLAITQRAVESMGGQIEVENHPGHGCTFKLLLRSARPSRISSIPPRPCG